MTEQEFVDIVPQLRALALQKALSYPSASDWADDVAQDSLIKMWALRESVSSRQHALGLVATMARHLTIDRLRKEHTVGLEQARNIVATERASERVEEESYGKWLDKALKLIYRTSLIRKNPWPGTEQMGRDFCSLIPYRHRIHVKRYTEILLFFNIFLASSPLLPIFIPLCKPFAKAFAYFCTI